MARAFHVARRCMKPYTPRPYQHLMTAHMIANPRSAVWCFMGGGKTASVLTALDALRFTGIETKPALILAPLRVARATWPNEAAKWEHLEGFKVTPIIGDPCDRLEALASKADAYTINYDNLPWLIEGYKDHADPWPFGAIVADESTRLKNARPSVQTSSTGKQFIRVAGGRRAGALARVAFQSSRFIELTGTPAPNGVEDLWGQAWFLDQGQRLGRTHESFIQRWFRPKKNGYGSEPLAHAQAEIQDRLKDVVLALNAKDWFDLRDPIVNVIKVDLPPKARKHYKEMERELFTVLEGHEIEANNAASKTIKCLQICNGAMFVDPPDTYAEAASKTRKWIDLHDAKLDALESVVEEAAGMPVLVAYHFKPDLARLLKRFPKGRALKTQKDEDDFKAGLIPVLFAHPQSAGHGIDGFQDVTNIICFYGLWWDSEVHDQIIERIGPVRQLQSGHERAVFIHYIVADRTIDEDVLERVRTKRNIQDILKEAMKRVKA